LEEGIRVFTMSIAEELKNEEEIDCFIFDGMANR
jgi:hypothetical protein